MPNKTRFSNTSRQMQVSVGSAKKQEPYRPEPSGAANSIRKGVPILFAVLESICVFLIGLSKIGILVSVAGFLAAEKASSFHSEKVRLPILLVAVVGSFANLYSVWNFHRLRNSSSAAWRRRPLTGRRKLKDIVLIVLSVAALLLVSFEIYVHPLFGS